MSLHESLNWFASQRRRALLWTAYVLLLFACVTIEAAEQSANRPRPRATRPARGGGPQTGTGTSDVVRAIIPAKSQR